MTFSLIFPRHYAPALFFGDLQGLSDSDCLVVTTINEQYGLSFSRVDLSDDSCLYYFTR